MPRRISDHLWRAVTSTRTAIFLISFIIVSAMAAGFVPQGQDPAYYTSHYGAVLGEVIYFIGLTEAFTAWWFVGAESLLLVSLSACVIRRTRRSWRLSVSFPFKHTPEDIRRSAWCVVGRVAANDRERALAEVQSLARRRGFKCRYGDGETSGWCLSGVRFGWAYFCSPVLHLGLALLLLGLILSPFTSLNEYHEAGEGELIPLQAHGYPFDLLVKDFQIEYYEDYQPKQYSSRLGIVEDGAETAEETISVNHPLRYAGAKAYQSSWGWIMDGVYTADDVQEAFSVFDGRDASISQRQDAVTVRARFFPDFVMGYDGVPRSLTPEPRNPRILYYVERPGEEPIVGMAALGESITLDDASLEFNGFRYYTGLQIKMEPMLPLVFAGFGLALLGLVLFYLVRPQRLWALVLPDEDGFLVYLAGDGKPGKFEGVPVLAGLTEGGFCGRGS